MKFEKLHKLITESELSTNVKKPSFLVSAIRNRDIIRIEFDAMHHIPTKGELEEIFGPYVYITQYQPGFASATRGTVPFRLDVVDGNGNSSSKKAEEVYRQVFGTDERINGKSEFSKIPLEDRFEFGRQLSMAANE